MASSADEGSLTEEETKFLFPIGTGMRHVEPGAGAEFDAATTERLRNKLEEFDAVRTRGEIESRSVHLGGRSSR
jgi:hypothetical protein